MGAGWSTENIPDLANQTILVTGSNRGLGYATVLELAKKNATVIMTARTKEKGNNAAESIRAIVPDAKLHVMELDLSTLSSVRTFATKFHKDFDSLTAIINNAGIASTKDMAFIETEDHLELVWQTNFYAPFLLTNLLMKTLIATAKETDVPSRVVMISSVTHAHARNDIDPAKGKDRVGRKDKGKKKCYEYPATKLADLMFSTTLHRKIQDNKELQGKILSVCAHPGFSSTDMTGGLGKVTNALFGMEASQGCLSQLRACCDPEVKSGEYVGPNTAYYGLQHVVGPLMMSGMTPYPELYGNPTLNATRTEYSKNERIGNELWVAAEEATGKTFEL